ncbi:sulfite exporter TauE/SafE family protein [Hansschlegelia sp. KR7-227]|uniref:sulfite exporter TauE/SafE family protein n=1 Tax=Hansschlegelia sp. KR7-227 TaxID=3400914 RepID=UPI003BFE5C12
MIADAAALTLAGGVMMGLASSLHCASMCGGVASAMMFAFATSDSSAARRRAIVLTQSGRAAGYMLAGGAAAMVGASVVAALDHVGGLIVLRWASAATLAWIGIATLGLVPPLRVLDGVATRVTAPLRRLASRSPQTALWTPFVGGLAWSCTPCAMALAAVVYASLTGSALGGVQVMAGFALGTMPAVVASAIGVARLRGFARRPAARVSVGLALVGLAVASAAAPGLGASVLCLTSF